MQFFNSDKDGVRVKTIFKNFKQKNYNEKLN